MATLLVFGVWVFRALSAWGRKILHTFATYQKHVGRYEETNTVTFLRKRTQRGKLKKKVRVSRRGKREGGKEE